MFKSKLFRNKKGQYAKAMRNLFAHQERNYRKIKARHLYYEKKNINSIALELGVSPNTRDFYISPNYRFNLGFFNLTNW